MKIKVKGFLTFRDLIGKQVEITLESGKNTLKDLLDRLSVKYGDSFSNLVFDQVTGDVNHHLAILINGTHYTHLPDRLDTDLHDGDEVAIFPPVAGG